MKDAVYITVLLIMVMGNCSSRIANIKDIEGIDGL
jgi:hypothetical protein